MLETVGDTGFRLNAITMWPATNSIVGVTSADDPQFPDHLVEVNHRSAEVTVLAALAPAPGPVPPGPSLPSDFRDIAVFQSQYSPEPVLLGLITRGEGSDSLERVLWETPISESSDFPSGLVRAMNHSVANIYNGFGRSGLFGLAAADWYDRPFPPVAVYLELATIGRTASESSVQEPPFVWQITPPPLPVGADLPHPACFSAALRTGINRWLGVQTDPTELPARQLTRIELEPWDKFQSPFNDEATLEEPGPLPDNPVGIAFGPALPPQSVPTLSRIGLIVLLALVAFVVVRRLRARS